MLKKTYLGLNSSQKRCSYWCMEDISVATRLNSPLDSCTLNKNVLMCYILLSFYKGVFYDHSYLRGGMETCVCRPVKSCDLSEKCQEDEQCSVPLWCGTFLNQSKTTKNEPECSYTIRFRLNGCLVPESTMAVKQILEFGKGCSR